MILDDNLELQIEGPFGFFQCTLNEEKVIAAMKESLDTGLYLHLLKENRMPTTFGTFNKLTVELVWDDEFEDRLFIKIHGYQTISYTIAGAMLEHFKKCIHQLAKDLAGPPT